MYLFVSILGFGLLVHIQASRDQCTITRGLCEYQVAIGRAGGCPELELTNRTELFESCHCSCNGAKTEPYSLKVKVARSSQTLQERDNTKDQDEQQANTEQVLAILAQTRSQLIPGSPLATVVLQATNEIQRLQSLYRTCRHDCKGPNQRTTTLTPTTPTPNYSMTFCDFESSNNCGFTQNGTAKWSRGQGRLYGYVVSGPVDDHTIGTPSGTYLYLDTHDAALSIQEEHEAILESPLQKSAPSYCLRFWYNMHGPDIQDLNVYAKVGSGFGYPVWSKHGSHSSAWELGEVDIQSEYTSTPFTIVFKATTLSYYEHVFAHNPRYHNYYGNIALDDIYIYNTKCNNIHQCPPGSVYRKGVVPRENSCYTLHTKALSWKEGQVSCKEENPHSHLVSINSAREHQFLINVIVNDPVLKAAGQSGGFFTSGNDEENEGVFVWTGHGNPYNTTYKDWYPGQPNNVGNNQHCLLLQYPDAHYQWGDVECSSVHPFICETDLTQN